jgi:hypothetical protein
MAMLAQRMTGGQSTADDVQRLRESASQGESSRYYYQRGQRVIWRDDFTKYEAGAFPQRMELVSGHFEVKNISGRNYFWTAAGGVVNLKLPEALPQRFSIEIEYDSPHALSPFLFATQPDQSSPACLLGSLNHESFLECNGNRSFVKASLPEGGRIHPRFTVDGEHVSGYINEQLLPPLPIARISRGRGVRLHVPGGTLEHPTLITVINIAEGGSRSAVQPR